jgi:hypothetical protein
MAENRGVYIFSKDLVGYYPGVDPIKYALTSTMCARRRQDRAMLVVIAIVFVILVVGILVVPLFFVVGIIEAEFVIIFLVIDRRKIEFHGIDRDHLEFNTALGAGNYFSYVLEFLIDNGFAFRTVAHNLPPIESIPGDRDDSIVIGTPEIINTRNF